MSPIGQHHQGGELGHAGQLGQHLDTGVGLGVLAQFAVDPLDHRGQAVDDGQVVGHELAGDRGQFEPG